MTDYKVLGETQNENVDELFDLYRRDPYLARVVFFNSNRDEYYKHRLIRYNKENGDFQIVLHKKSYGISITNKIYNSEVKLFTISYKAKDKKLWLIYKNKSNKNSINMFSTNTFINSYSNVRGLKVHNLVYVELFKEFPWVEMMAKENVLDAVPFNTIISKKLFGLKKALRYQYKVPYPVAKILHKVRVEHEIKQLKYYIAYLTHIENFNEDLIANAAYRGLFFDAIKMAKTLDKRINVGWSVNRLKLEHDKMAEEITEIIFAQNNKELNIDPIYKEFANFSGWELLLDTKSMSYEGKRMNHCVATYVSTVNSGRCAIFRVNDRTLEVRVSKSGLKIGQYRGYGNSCAPSEDVEVVKAKIEEFNEKKMGGVTKTTEFTQRIGDGLELDDLLEDVWFDERLGREGNDYPFDF